MAWSSFGSTQERIRFYQIKLGTGVRREPGLYLLGDVYFATRLIQQGPERDPFHTSREVRIPASSVDRPGRAPNCSPSNRPGTERRPCPRLFASREHFAS
jgi:hypothetical protein